MDEAEDKQVEESPVDESLEAPEEMSLLRELWLFMMERKAWWITPIVVVVVLLGALIVLAQGSAVAPFIYTLF